MVTESHKLVCASCGSEHVVTEKVYQTFPYGEGESRVMLSAVVPVHVCQECKEEFTDSEAARIRHEAVCRHLRVMTPREIVELRESLGYTQQQLADLTGIGIASIARWENGYNIQNSAHDKFLRLLKHEDNRRRLAAMQEFVDPPLPARVAVAGSKSKFRSLSDQAVKENREVASKFSTMLASQTIH